MNSQYLETVNQMFQSLRTEPDNLVKCDDLDSLIKPTKDPIYFNLMQMCADQPSLENSQYFYKMCSGHMVIFKTCENTTVEGGEGQYAKNRATLLEVVRLINISDLSDGQTVTECSDQPATYTVGNICSSYCFKNPSVAYFNRTRPDNYTGRWFVWDDDGHIVSMYCYTDGICCSYILFHENGNKKEERLIDLYGCGSFVAWHPNGTKKCGCDLVNGMYSGKYKEWYADGQMMMEGRFYNGKQIGGWSYWKPCGGLLLTPIEMVGVSRL
jgi:hypothetical protein